MKQVVAHLNRDAREIRVRTPLRRLCGGCVAAGGELRGGCEAAAWRLVGGELNEAADACA